MGMSWSSPYSQQHFKSEIIVEKPFHQLSLFLSHKETNSVTDSLSYGWNEGKEHFSLPPLFWST